VEKKMTEAPEPKGKLDATTTVVVSGPKDAAERWRQIDWRRAEADVRRLRQRIFTASKAGDLTRVRRLQRLMLRSRANMLVSVRRVTERNAGRLTAGVDGEVVLTPEAKMQLADRVQHGAEPFKAMPVRRVYIPKRGSSTKRRPLGIPVIVDRCHQARVVNALEPEWEARFEPKSYGFRPGRGCQDAIQALYTVARGNAKRLWALDADLASAFDLIAHDQIQSMIGSFPARGMIRAWLKAGVVEQGRLHRTEDGVPQGSLCAAAHNEPYEQRWVMGSVRLDLLLRTGSVAERCA
jgi:RNA-directed DNA polymerase